MPDDASTADTTTDTTADTTTDTAGQTFTQEQVNTFLAEQKRKIGNVTELKAAAAELATIKDAQKSAEQKQTDRVTALEAEIRAAHSEALRLRVASKFGISDEDADLFLTGEDEEALTNQAKRLTDRESDRKKQGNFVAREGSTTHSADSAELETTRALFGSN